MITLQVRNVHEALPRALDLLYAKGIERPSRNGPVLQMPCPVTTVYERPTERVIFWEERDANPFFHLYESLWMLAGRNDIAPLGRYAKNMLNYSDDGVTQHAAYGHRWRRHFPLEHYSRRVLDQLPIIIKALRKNREDRRCVLQMWDATDDLGREGKDFPCNTTATFQVDPDGRLSLTVFCRSNDIVYGAYGANAVHFSFLLEYMALAIGVPVGVYRQVSVNWHGYLNTLEPLQGLRKLPPVTVAKRSPYLEGTQPNRMFHGSVEEADRQIQSILMEADSGLHPGPYTDDEPFFNVARLVLRTHALHKERGPYHALGYLQGMGDPKNDWIRAATEWLKRRAAKMEEK